MTSEKPSTGSSTSGTDWARRKMSSKNKRTKTGRPGTQRERVLHNNQAAGASAVQERDATGAAHDGQKTNKIQTQQESGSRHAKETLPQRHCHSEAAKEVLPKSSCHAAQNASGANTIKTNYGAPGGKRIAANPPKLLLDDADVNRWYDNMKRSSSHNADVCLRRLNLFCDRTKTTPSGLVKIGESSPKDVEDRLLDHVTWMEKCGYSPSYIAGVVKSVKSWLAHNRVDIRRRIRITDAGACTTINDEKVPEQDHLRSMLASATPRGRAIISLMAFSGIRPHVMGLADASDGLRVGDLPDLQTGGKKITFSRMPAMITVRHNLSKTRNKYVTFLSEEGCEHLLGYLQYRVSHGDTLGPEEPLIAVVHRNRGKGWANKAADDPPFMTTPAITGSIRETIWAVTKVRPYALRAYFDTQLLLAESHGCMTHAYRQFFMGHKGDMEARYTTNKGRLTEQMREDMRRAYAQSQAFLSTDTDKGTDGKKEMLLGMWRQQARMYGMDPDEMIKQGPGQTGKMLTRR